MARCRLVLSRGNTTRARVAGLACVVLAATSGATGCAEPKVSLSSGAREYTESDYEQVLRRWTREKSLVVLSELDNLLTVTATYESWDFRWAYVVKYANDYRLTVEQRRTLLERTLAETQDGHHFYVALYGSKVRWADLTRGDSSWIVRLIGLGVATPAASLRLELRPVLAPIAAPAAVAARQELHVDV